MGVVSNKRGVKSELLAGLSSLEYRGYDSTGLAILDSGELECIKQVGKVSVLAEEAQQCSVDGKIGIAHTRWATHGEPSKLNAHPHISNQQLAIVHNGIIENYQELKADLIERGYSCVSDTDTEVLAHLLHSELEKNSDLLQACLSIARRLQGSFALAIMHKNHPDKLFTMRSGSPLVLGLAQEANYISSDMGALLTYTDKFVCLEDGDVAVVTANSVSVVDSSGTAVERDIYRHTMQQQDSVDKGEYKHYMLQEIYAQGEAVAATLQNNSDKYFGFGPNSPEIFQQLSNIHFVACGTSLHAAQVACYWIEETCNIPCNAFVASEFRYAVKAAAPGTLFVALSQSGETADTLAAFRNLDENYVARLAICNVAQSSLMRESEIAYHTCAGREVGVAATKTFSAQLVALLQLVQAIATARNITIPKQLQQNLDCLVADVAKVLDFDTEIQELAQDFVNIEHAIFLGRNVMCPIAAEGALKLKEISYINAHAYPGGELKHGPLACVDQHMPVIVLAPYDALADKLQANIAEVAARGGQIYLIASSDINWSEFSAGWIKMPKVGKFTAPLLYNIPLQLLAYHVALLKGTDVDQPRNLAKSVTVE